MSCLQKTAKRLQRIVSVLDLDSEGHLNTNSLSFSQILNYFYSISPNQIHRNANPRSCRPTSQRSSARPRRILFQKDEESDPAGKHPNAQPRGNYFEEVIDGCGRTSTADLAWSLIVLEEVIEQPLTSADPGEIGPSSGEVAKRLVLHRGRLPNVENATSLVGESLCPLGLPCAVTERS